MRRAAADLEFEEAARLRDEVERLKMLDLEFAKEGVHAGGRSGGYGAKMQRLAADDSPNLMLMNYDLARFAVTDLFFVPKQFFTPAIIAARSPLRRRRGEPGGSARRS